MYKVLETGKETLGMLISVLLLLLSFLNHRCCGSQHILEMTDLEGDFNCYAALFVYWKVVDLEQYLVSMLIWRAG